MKKNLISYTQARVMRTLLLLLISMELFASSYEWRVSANRERAYINEAIHLSFVCEFDDEAELYAVEFDPLKKYENLTIKTLSQRSRLKDGKKILEYEYLLFIHKAGEHLLAFDALMKKTTQDSIRDTIIGRDNEKYAQYQTSRERLESIKIDVLESNLGLVGEFALQTKSDLPQVKALTPYHLEVIIEGSGNFDAIESLAFEIEGVQVFSEEPKQKLTLTADGYSGRWSQKFAFVAQSDFRIEPFVVEYFSPQSQSKKELRFDGVDVEIQEGYTQESLLDVEESTEPLWSIDYLYYLLSFVAGYLLSKVEFKRAKSDVESSFCNKIKKSASLEALSILLVMQDAKKYKKIIEQIEKKELTSLAKARKLIAQCR